LRLGLPEETTPETGVGHEPPEHLLYCFLRHAGPFRPARRLVQASCRPRA
jgi:hypothetical protein